jgi:hypothetical protein
MQLTIDPPRSKQHTKGRLYQVALWLAAFVIALQLVGMAFHKHDLTEQSDNCVSCYMAAQLPSGMPKAPAEVLITLAALVYRIALQPIYFFIAEQSYLIPPSQAPPRISSPV